MVVLWNAHSHGISSEVHGAAGSDVGFSLSLVKMYFISVCKPSVLSVGIFILQLQSRKAFFYPLPPFSPL